MGKNSQIDNIKVSGDIESCCQAKGCWMKIVNGSDPRNYIFWGPVKLILHMILEFYSSTFTDWPTENVIRNSL